MGLKTMRKSQVLFLAVLAVLVTGCPHNQYLVELTPHGKVMDRKLVFYCEDGTDTNGAPNYRDFPAAELRAIRKYYPKDSVKQEGQRHIAEGEFAGAMPDDVGGAGSYTMLSNNLGSVAFYVERFRGDDDIGARIQKHLKAADQLVDYIMGWAHKELGGERHYQDLRRFLDGDFRRDVRNLSLHGWMVQTQMTTRAPAPEEFAVRFGQYLLERGYFKMEDVADIVRGLTEGDSRPLMRGIQELVAQKLRIPKSKPMPQSLAFLADADKAGKSWVDYLATTAEYRVKLRHWQMQKATTEAELLGQKIAGFMRGGSQTNGAAAANPPARPEPSEVANELAEQLIEFNFMGTDDHLVVKLSLPSAPTHTNGKWDESRKQVVWESDLGERTNSIQLPAFCYASWVGVDEEFQRAHLGKVILKGDDFLQYCLWRGGLDEKRAREWDALLAALQPGDGLQRKVEGFRFSGEGAGAPRARNPQSQSEGSSEFPRQLIKTALEAKPQAGGQ